MVTGHSQIESAPITVTSTHSSPEDQHTPAQAQVQSNDSSNISVNSEKELEIVVINTKNSSNPPNQQPETNKGRKRKRLDFTPRLDQKKITDYRVSFVSSDTTSNNYQLPSFS